MTIDGAKEGKGAVPDRSTPRRVLSFIAFPLVLGTVFLLLWLFHDPILRVFSSPEAIRDWVGRWGLLAPLLFILLQFVQVVIFVIPGEVVQIAGGYLFGMWLGTLYSLVGITVGSMVNFLLGRYLGVPFVEAVFGAGKLARFEAILSSRRATAAFFLLFAIPGIPKDALSYVAGLSPLGFGWFLLVSTIGRLPGILGSSAIGGAAAKQMWLTVGFIVVAAVILFVVGMLYRDQLHGLIERFASKKTPKEPGGSPRT